MKISSWPQQKNPSSPSGQMVKITRNEAIRLIASLAGQMKKNNCNTPREEFYTENGDYFSIAVQEEGS